MDKKIIFIPGWMYSSEYFTLGEGLNVWSEDIDLSTLLDCEYLIGHSMGAAMALKAWSYNQDKKLILVDPFIEQSSIFKTMIDWARFIWREGSDKAGRLGLRHLPKNILQILKFPEENYWEIVESIPREKLKILHGEKDLFLSNEKICEKFIEIGFEVINIPEAGHDWHKNFDNKIIEITKD
jgi:pimeloyl-ACP methyl ester carboxylesterase